MAFTVRSNSFKDGDYLGKEHILSADFGFGCAEKTSPRTLRGRARLPAPRALRSPALIPMLPRGADSGTGWSPTFLPM